MMYNENIKKQYIEEKQKTNINAKKQLEVKFSNASVYEEQLGIDLYDFSISDIVTYYKKLMVSSLESLIVLNNYFALYADWALSRNLISDSQNHFREMNNDLLYSCISLIDESDTFMTRKEMLSRVRKFSNPCDAFLVCALFEGVGGTGYVDFKDLSMKNFENETTLLLPNSNRKLTVSKELYSFALESSEEYNHYSRYDATQCKVGFLKTDPNIIKMLANSRGENDDSKVLRNTTNSLRRIKEYTESNYYKAHNLNESGRVDFIKKLMEADNNYDIRTIIMNHEEEISYRYGNILSITRYILKYGKYYEGE